MFAELSVSRYLDAWAKARQQAKDTRAPVRPFLTLSREAGAGAMNIGKRVVAILNEQPRETPWTLFDRELVTHVLETHNLPRELEQHMTEEAISTFRGFVGDLFGMHPPAHTLVRKTNETILALAQMGNVVLVGRGGNYVTHQLETGFHVRLVASVEKRRAHFQEHTGLSESEATDHVKNTDQQRSDYVRDVFGKNVADTMAYDCVVNTTRLSFDTVARMIAVHLG